MLNYVIGLTGGIGSGKSTVSNIFASFGVPIVDADIISKKLVKYNMPAFKSIIKHFGSSILNKDGFLKRSVIRDHIFNDLTEKNWLNNLLHPIIIQEIKSSINRIHFGIPYVICVIPLLIENHLHKFTNRILVIDTTYENQIMRVMKRDNVIHNQVEKILAEQASRELRLKYANDIIYNNKNYEKLRNDVISLHKFYLRLTKNLRSNI